MALRLWGCCITIFYSQNMEITCYFFFSWLKMTWMVSSQQTLPSILAKPTCSSYFASFDVTSGQFKTEKKIEPTKSTRDEKRTHMWQKERTNNVFLFVSHVEQKERFPCSMVFPCWNRWNCPFVMFGMHLKRNQTWAKEKGYFIEKTSQI